MKSSEQYIETLRRYIKYLQEGREFLFDLIPEDVNTPKKIRSRVPSKKKANKILIDRANYRLSRSQSRKSPGRTDSLKGWGRLLSDSDFRSKCAELLIAREQRKAEREIKQLEEEHEKVCALDEEIAAIADEYGFEGNRFIDVDPTDDPMEMWRRLGIKIGDAYKLIRKIKASEKEKAERGNIEKSCKDNVKLLTEIPEECKWEDVTIEIKDDETVIIKVKNKSFEKKYGELDFADGRTSNKRPNKLWEVWLSLAIKKSFRDSVESIEYNKKDIQRIRRLLQRVFGIEDNPIHPYLKRIGWRCKFDFIDRR